MSFISSIIVVEDIARSRKLYEEILQLKVTADFGIYNVAFEGGLSLYRKAFFQELITGATVHLDKHNNVVLYFEIDNLDEMEKEILENGFEFIHAIKEQPWKQRNFRFYDYDSHILEIAEKMEIVFQRLLENGNSIDEISRLTGIPVEQVMKEIGKEREMK